MKVIAFILFFVCSNSILGQSISLEEYFPLKNGVIKVYYVSHITETDTLQDKNDLSICKSLLVKGKEIFYFDDELSSNDTTLISSQSFCNGAFYYDKGNFVFSPLDWKYELKVANLDYFETLFPSLIFLDTIYKIQNGEEKREYKFTGFENISIKNKILKDCLKLTIISNWRTAQYIETVWFNKGIGVVKWLRRTGRLEELKL